MGKMMLIVGIGGFIGTVLRYLIGLYFAKIWPSSFPYGTFIINITGCLLIGLFYGIFIHHHRMSIEMSIFLITGFCGGFTTFSSFAFENATLLQNSQYLTFALYTLGSFILGLLAVFGGIMLGKL